MRKSIMLLIVALVAGSSYSFGQSASRDKISYGIKAGVNLATFQMGDEGIYGEDLKKRPTISFHIGGHADFALTDVFSLQGGLTLSGKGFREIWSGEDEFDGFWYDGSYRESLIYLEIPVNAVYKTGRFYWGAGPYVGYALSGKWKEQYEEDFGDGDVEKEEESGKVIFSGDDAYRKRLDFGVNFLAGYQLNTRMNLGIGYGLGLNNISPDIDWTIKNRVLSLSLGYTF